MSQAAKFSLAAAAAAVAAWPPWSSNWQAASWRASFTAA